jgi:hypothetical protein
MSLQKEVVNELSAAVPDRKPAREALNTPLTRGS